MTPITEAAAKIRTLKSLVGFIIHTVRHLDVDEMRNPPIVLILVWVDTKDLR